ncbi:MAG: cytochrome P450 [Deltaproteobacteria bacterium]|nr:cytochrome P450 [Deltaproteobacteria bacterium]
MSASTRFDRGSLDCISALRYEQAGYPYHEWAWLREHEPVAWIEHPDYDPFWAITKHADVIELSKQPALFENAPRLAVFSNKLPPPPEAEIHHLLNMDPPDHGKYRNVASRQFTPRVVHGLHEKVERITREVLDEAASRGQGDFVRDVSAPITIAVIAEMLGVPARDRGLLFRWTNEVIAPEDPEFQRGGGPESTLEAARIELFQYFDAMARERRERPREDIVSVVANGAVDDAALGAVELLSYYLLLVVAGNETTRNAMTGGMIAFLEHPAEWARLRRDEGVLDLAVEEVVRWVTPVIQFCRTPRRDYVLRGRTIRAGQSTCLFYPSANRDEEIFEDPDVFRVDRSPNRHLGFGVGEHVCLGAHLARLELRCAFAALRERLVFAELDGPVERARSSFVGGIKRAPMRWEIRA